jgi:glyoxalase family protein
MATHIGYSVPTGSIEFWKNRLIQNGVNVEEGNVLVKK